MFNSSFESLPMEEAQKILAKDPSIHIIDVRTRDEYATGHIPHSVNLPLDEAAHLPNLVPDREAAIFVYCQSGARSRRASEQFSRMGYTKLTNIGGIYAWRGTIERGR